MKNILTGKQINEWAQQVNKLPDYWGDKFDWSDKHSKYIHSVKGEFIAKKYKAIVELIQETKAEVHVTYNCILIKYDKGESKINRDVLVDNFLLPLINITVGFNSVAA